MHTPASSPAMSCLAAMEPAAERRDDGRAERLATCQLAVQAAMEPAAERRETGLDRTP